MLKIDPLDSLPFKPPLPERPPRMHQRKKVSIGETSKPQERVIRVTNIHFDATNNDIDALFSNYNVIDWKRDINTKTGKLTVAYFLMSTMQEANRAQQDLDYSYLLGRPVRVMRARGGFKLNAEGYLNTRERGFPVTVSGPPQGPPPMTNYQPPTVEEEGGPSSVPPYTPHRHRRRFNSEDPDKRVLLINNLHPDATEVAVKLFFNGFDVVAFKRNPKVSTGKPRPVGFVLLGSFEQRNRAKEKLNGHKLMGRSVEIECVDGGVKVNEAGFDFHETDVTNTPSERPSAKASVSALPEDSLSSTINFPTQLPARPPLTKPKSEPRTRPTQQSSAIVGDVNHNTPAISEPPWAVNLQGIWDYSRAQQTEVYSSWYFDQAHKLLRPWNLSGNDSTDRRHNMVTEDDWYYFQPR